MRIKPRNKRLLIVLEGTEKGRLKGIKTKGGIEIPLTTITKYEGGATEASIGMQNRWAKVVAAGPLCAEVQEGDRVCLPAQKWTEAMEIIEGEWFWFSDEDEVMMIDMLYRETEGKEQTDTDDILTRHRMKGMYE
jgi:co-chaperonin GroES (HSP10)